jgi:hypothetical protein
MQIAILVIIIHDTRYIRSTLGPGNRGRGDEHKEKPS